MSDVANGRWAKLSVDFFDHPKVANLTASDRERYLMLVTYSAKFLTDGQLSKSDIGTRWGQKWSRCVPILDRLMSAGLIEKRTHEDRFSIHDFTDWQETRAQAESRREAARERQRNRYHRAKGQSPAVNLTPLGTDQPHAVTHATREEKSLFATQTNKLFSDHKVSEATSPEPSSVTQTPSPVVPLVELVAGDESPLMTEALRRAKLKRMETNV